ncbi:5-formyltetrahydrofolate cyclo-ligase [Sporolactobacillus sp. STCC-11]|uniref:5-formyltetrahydrofolate cyclo-ligase n=1 Tax=Sporolactobacillus caesalpiniae TaxID=3230362 RepID=UPI00339830E3
MSLEKRKLRNQILHEMEKTDEYVFTEKCKKIRNQLFATALWREALTIGVTLSVGREVETMAIITKAWTEQKHVAVPKCNPQNHSLSFYELESFSQLESGFYELMEPNILKTQEVKPDMLDLLIVPGVVFDERGFRIGYGGGYYDRFLTHYEGTTISLLLENQLIHEIPVEAHDQHVDWLITEQRCFKASEGAE